MGAIEDQKNIDLDQRYFFICNLVLILFTKLFLNNHSLYLDKQINHYLK